MEPFGFGVKLVHNSNPTIVSCRDTRDKSWGPVEANLGSIPFAYRSTVYGESFCLSCTRKRVIYGVCSGELSIHYL